MLLFYKLNNVKFLSSIVILSFVISIVCMPFEPAHVPIHFGPGGADGYLNKYTGLLVLPVFMLLLLFGVLKKNSFKMSALITLLFLVHLFTVAVGFAVIFL